MSTRFMAIVTLLAGILFPALAWADAANQWVQVTPDCPVMPMSFAIDAQGDIYTAANHTDMWRLKSGGNAWENVSTGIDVPTTWIPMFSLNKSGEAILGVCTHMQGANGIGQAYRFNNKTNSWNQATGITSTMRVSSFVLNSLGEVVAVDGHAGNVYISHDGGDSYTKVAQLSAA
jgi:hypothetical protein